MNFWEVSNMLIWKVCDDIIMINLLNNFSAKSKVNIMVHFFI